MNVDERNCVDVISAVLFACELFLVTIHFVPVLLRVVYNFVALKPWFAHSRVYFLCQAQIVEGQILMWMLTAAHDHKAAVGFQRKTDWDYGELDCKFTIFFSVYFLYKLVVSAVFGLTFFKEAWDDLLNVFGWNVNSFAILFLFLIKNILESRTNVSDLSFLICDTDQRGLSHLEFVNIRHK